MPVRRRANRDTPHSGRLHSRRESGDLERLVEVEVEHVHDLEVGAVYQGQVAANKHMHVTGRRRRQKRFYLLRAGFHSASQFGRHESTDNDLALQSRW